MTQRGCRIAAMIPQNRRYALFGPVEPMVKWEENG